MIITSKYKKNVERTYVDLEVKLAGSVVCILLIALYILICTFNVTLIGAYKLINMFFWYLTDVSSKIISQETVLKTFT